MFDSPFDFLALLIAVVAFIVARKAFNQTALLRARLDAIEAAASQARPATSTVTGALSLSAAVTALRVAGLSVL